MLDFLFFLVRSLLSLRYRVSFRGDEVFDTSSSVIVFPNHPALVDPMLLVSHIGKKKILSPVMTETYFHTPGLAPIIRALGTIPVGDLARGGDIEDVKSAFQGIETAMKEGRNILIYPSGHIYVQPFEHIIGKKMAYEIVRMLSGDTRIIVTRTKGLWGSMWGKAYTGTSPELINVLLKSIWYILANLIFFIPKRDVSIEFVDMTDTLREWSLLPLDEFNQKLQDYYNTGGNEPCVFRKHYWFLDDVANKTEPTHIEGSVAEMLQSNTYNPELIPSEVLDTVSKKVAEIKKILISDISPDSNLVIDLHADSLDMAEMKSAIQSLFTTSSNPPISKIKTVRDLAALACGILEGEEMLPEVHFSPAVDETIDFSYTPESTIPSMIQRNFRSEKKKIWIYDALFGSMSRDGFLLKSYVISEYIRIQKGENIGIMLPALSMTSLLLTGIYMAGKVPVMLNWTVGEKSFAHCMEFAGLEILLTSRKFYEKIQSPWLEKFQGKMIFIEDIITQISLSMKLRAYIRKTLTLIPRVSPTDTAVMLFTSGSESVPKAVALSHQNILSDIAGALMLVPFHRYETLLGFLPPFHSFGFTINTIFPLVAPVQVAYSPDPNDAGTLVKLLSHTRTTILSATPTFLRMILARGQSSDLESLRYAFVGAEKCSDEVFALAGEKCPEVVLLEGYGITECSPIVSVNPLEKQKRGTVGKILPQVDIQIRSIDTHEVQGVGGQGMIYVSGASIFDGYLDTSIESPFDTFDEKKWYKTGDLGYLDEEGYLFITGRLKRFVKIAGEMISLPFIESILLEHYGNPEFPTLAIEAKEVEGTVSIVAFVTFPTSVDELNDYIHTHGASNLVKISRIENLESIPVLGTGKTDYKQLKSII